MGSFLGAANLPADFDSTEDDDEEVEALQTGSKVIGQRTYDKILANAAKDRKLSRKALDNHQSVANAPGTQHGRELWRNYYRAFALSLGRRQEECPTGEDIYRFIITIVENLDTRIPGKPAISRNTIVTGMKYLKWMLEEEYDEFTISVQYNRRIESLLNRLVKEGKLIQGIWNEMAFVGIAETRKMSIAFLRDALEEGSHSWDITLSKVTSVLTVSALAARVGDVLRTCLYDGMQCLTWGDLELKFKDDSNNGPDNLQLNVRLHFVKGFKAENGTFQFLPLDALLGPEQNVLCVVKLLTILAMRTGAVEAQNFEELTTKITAKRDKTARWKTPKRPVFSAFAKGGHQLNIEMPAGALQMQRTLSEMGRRAGILAHITPHDLRRGAAREIAHLEQWIPGHATMGVAQQLNHSMDSYMKGTTTEYTGGSNVDVYSLRVAAGFKDRRAPKHASVGFKPESIKRHEIAPFAEEHGYDLDDENSRQMAYKAYDKSRFNDYLKAAADEDSRPSESSRSLQTGLEIQAAPIQGRHANRSASNPALPEYHDEGIMDDEEMESEADNVLQMISGDGQDRQLTEDDIHDMLSGALDDDPQRQPCSDTAEAQQDPLLLPVAEFIDYFAAINSVVNQNKPHDWVPNAATGNSRNPPTRFTCRCKNFQVGCISTFTKKQYLDMHMESCTASADNPIQSAYPCNRCPAVLTSEAALTTHVRNEHEFYNVCPVIQCTDRTIFTDRNEYSKHRDSHFWDPSNPCRVPDCRRTRSFATRDSYNSHLRHDHMLPTDQAREYAYKIPKIPRWGPQRNCPVKGCGMLIKKQVQMMEHLTDASGHGLSYEEYTNMVEVMLIGKQNAKQERAKKRKLAEEAGEVRSGWGTRRCFITGCSLLFKGRGPMFQHLIDSQGHGIEKDEAGKGIDEMLEQHREAKEESKKPKVKTFQPVRNWRTMKKEKEPAAS